MIKQINEIAVCSSAYKELLHNTVTLEQLSNYPIISLGPETMTHKRFASLFIAVLYHLTKTIQTVQDGNDQQHGDNIKVKFKRWVIVPH